MGATRTNAECRASDGAPDSNSQTDKQTTRQMDNNPRLDEEHTSEEEEKEEEVKEDEEDIHIRKNTLSVSCMPLHITYPSIDSN